MLETRPISACAKLKPVEQMKSEISSVELIAELVEVELQKVPLDVMVRVKNTPLCIAYIATNQSKIGRLLPCITVPERRVTS